MVNQGVVSRGQLGDPFEGREGSWYVLQGKIRGDRIVIDAPGKRRITEECFRLRRERDAVFVGPVAQRLLARTIAGEHQPLRTAVPDGKGKHAVEMRDAIHSILRVRGKNYLGVGPSPEPMSRGRQSVAKLLKVVDLS